MTAPVYQQYPAQAYAPPAQYPPQQQPQFPPQQFAPGYPPATPAAPAQPLAQGTIDDFYAQPSTGGGKSISFQNKPVGTAYAGIVTRPITSGDIQQQTDTQGRPQTFRDGRPKFVMKVPLQMQPSPEHPDGLGTWYVKGQARDELVRAMAEAGAPAGPPEAGAGILIQFTGERQSGPGMNPAKLVHVTYSRPDGSASSSQAAPAPEPSNSAVAAGVPGAIVPPPAPAAAPAPVAQPAPPPAAAPAPAPAAQPAPPADMSDEQKALLARLTGQQQG